MTGNTGGHFFAAAAEAMRRILIDCARKRSRQRHGAGLERINLDSVDLAATTDDDTLKCRWTIAVRKPTFLT